jgi:succinate dehydrogenase/fumarate reductase cytochrome b subunit
MEALLFTNVAYAASESVNDFISKVNTLIINPLIILLFALAVVYFLYGVFQFISNQESEEAKTKGKSHMLWGIIGIVVMMGVFTILNMIMNTFNIDYIKPETGDVKLPPYTP